MNRILRSHLETMVTEFEDALATSEGDAHDAIKKEFTAKMRDIK